ncbi:hypothetical protein GOB94_01070 [Granulicella sp. 5B5]|nr:hypothetical protein [Granulicella sp. 5B5]QMV17456.1 hypothetical protein GOB94_01070 [Granulicella sp. 5B5]
MVTVILLFFFAVLAVVLAASIWGGNAGRRAGARPQGSRENINAHTPPTR